MLGGQLCPTLSAAGHVVIGTTLPDLDITDPRACADAVDGADWVVNCAAYTSVDAAETNEALAFRVNAQGAATVARAAHATGARMLHLSTDYVFSGNASTPYAETAPLAPVSAYGRTKAAGEWAVRAECPDAVIVRTAWLYGPGGRNIVATMARLARERETVSFVSDQHGQPTTTRDVSLFISDLLRADVPPGIYHGTSEGETTWFALARAVFEELGMSPDRVRPIASAEFPLPAARPAYSVLGHDGTDAVGVARLPHWRVGLAETIADVTAATA